MTKLFHQSLPNIFYAFIPSLGNLMMKEYPLSYFIHSAIDKDAFFINIFRILPILLLFYFIYGISTFLFYKLEKPIFLSIKMQFEYAGQIRLFQIIYIQVLIIGFYQLIVVL